jgi:DegV family protein with EDD domain
MMTVRIVTDSTSDLPQDVVGAYGIEVVPTYINVDGRSYLDIVELPRQTFYERLPYYTSPPTTSTPGPDRLLQVYDRLVDEGATAIVSIHVAGSLSGFVDTAQLAARQMTSVPVMVVDSGQLSLGLGLLALEAAKAATSGAAPDEIVSRVNEKARRTTSFAILDTLEYLRRSGRLSWLQSSLGAILNVKPLLTLRQGELAMERTRTRKRAIGQLLAYVKGLGPLAEAALVHTHSQTRLEELKQRAAHLLPDGDIFTEDVTPALGVHLGPGGVGLICVSHK